MHEILVSLLHGFLSSFRRRADLQIEIIALRHQLEVLKRGPRTQARLTRLDRTFWVLLYRLWSGCLGAVVVVKPDTVVQWHRKGFRIFWAWKSRPRKRGRPAVSADLKALIRRMSRENSFWGAPRIHGELLKLGIGISQAAVSKYMIRHPKPPSQTWRTFLRNHACCLAGVDFFVVPTATFRLLFVLIVLHHERRRILHFGVTAHPSSLWASQQIREAFPWDTAPRYLIRDRDGSYGTAFRSRLQAMGVEEVLIAPRSPRQNAYAERVIGSIRRECLDHVIVLNEGHLRRILLPIAAITIGAAHTCRSRRIAPNPAACSLRARARSSLSHRSAGSITATNDSRPERRTPSHPLRRGPLAATRHIARIHILTIVPPS